MKYFREGDKDDDFTCCWRFNVYFINLPQSSGQTPRGYAQTHPDLHCQHMLERVFSGVTVLKFVCIDA